MITIDDFVKVLLVLSVCFSLVGISIQIIRMLGGLVDTVKTGNKIVNNASTLVEKVTGDYDYISEQVKMIVDLVSKFVNKVLGPVVRFFGKTKGFSKPSKTKPSQDEETVDEEE